MLQYQVLDQGTLDLLMKISSNALFREYRLVGGTSLALQFGHRKSIDLDFFGNALIDFDTRKEIEYCNERVL